MNALSRTELQWSSLVMTNAWTNVSSACCGRERRTLQILAHCRKARSNDAGDVGHHGDITVDVNTKVPNSGDR